jgi:hypothetical protein
VGPVRLPHPGIAKGKDVEGTAGMSALLLGARLGLALIFAVAAIGKLSDQSGSRETLARFGTPRSLIRAGALILPLTELAVAALLVPAATARVGALAGLALLIVFCAAIYRVLARGERPDCGCLARVHSAPVGAGTLVRNSALGALAAAIAVAGPGDGLGDALAAIGASPITFAVALGFIGQAWLSWQLVRQHARLIARVRVLEAAVDRPAQASALPVMRRVPDQAAGGPPAVAVESERWRAVAG